MDNTENKSNIFDKFNSEKMKTKWLKFYIFILLPLFIIGELALSHVCYEGYKALNGNPYYFVIILIHLAMLFLSVCTLILILKSKKAGYNLNILLLICQGAIFGYYFFAFDSTIYEASDIMNHINDIIMMISVWSGSNIIYFYFRKPVLIKDLIEHDEKPNMTDALSNNKIKYFVREFSFNKVLKRINAYGENNKFLKFYLFYYMPIGLLYILAWFTTDYTTQIEKYLNLIDLIFNAIAYYYLLQLNKKGYYWNFAYLIISPAWSFVYGFFTGTALGGIVLGAIVNILILVYFKNRKEMFFKEK